MSILKRKNQAGKLRYTAVVRKMVRGEKFSESQTFSSLQAAKAWERKRLAELEGMSSLQALQEDRVLQQTVGELVTLYLERAPGLGRCKQAVLAAIAVHPFLSQVRLKALSASHLFQFCQLRRAQCQPQTIWQDVSFLRSVFKQARVLLGVELDDSAFAQALPTLKEQGLVSKSRQRSRRTSDAELARLLAYFRQPSGRRQIPMADIVEFAFESGMRRSEICNLRWAHLDSERGLVRIMARKDPSNKHSNDQDVPLTPRALAIIAAQPQGDERIFPWKSASICASFIRATEALKIDDLRFHDLRRSSLTRFIEAGLSEFEVRQISGHKDVKMLQRYVNISPEQVANKLRDLPL